MFTKVKKFSYKRNLSQDDLKVTAKDDWTRAPTHPVSKVHNEPLSNVCCPLCNADFQIRNLSIKRGTHYANLKRKTCDGVRSSRFWRCDCDIPWIKCCTHALVPRTPKRPLDKRPRKSSLRESALDQPLPKRFAYDIGDIPVPCSNEPVRPIGLNPGSKLALRFPHLVKSTNPTKGGGAGEGI